MMILIQVIINDNKNIGDIDKNNTMITVFKSTFGFQITHPGCVEQFGKAIEMDQYEVTMLKKLGLVRIDGKRVFDNLLVPEDANMRAFTAHGIQVQKPVTRLWMMNKPRQYPQKRRTIYQIIPPFFTNYGHIVSVGRLDFNSQGLLLLTNDVKLKNLLQNPAANMTRVYRVKVHGRVSPDKLQKMSAPMKINGQQYGPLQVTVDRSLTTNVWLNVSMKTGKNRQIRRIMQKCDLQVNKLIRTQYGPYKLNTLKHGQVKQILISQGLERRLKIEKAKQLGKNMKGCLIQIDIRNRAIAYATLQQQAILEQQGKNKPQIQENKKVSAAHKKPEQKNSSNQQQSESQDDS